MTGDSELGLWDNELTLRGMVRAVGDSLNPAIKPIQVCEVAANITGNDPDALDRFIAAAVVQKIGVAPLTLPEPEPHKLTANEYYNKYTGVGWSWSPLLSNNSTYEKERF